MINETMEAPGLARVMFCFFCITMYFMADTRQHVGMSSWHLYSLSFMFFVASFVLWWKY